MSLQAINYVIAQKTPGAVSRCLLLAIAHHVSNETGKCFAGQKLLADEADIAERTVREHLAKLEEAEFIKRTPRYRSNEGRTSDEIELVGFLGWYAEIAQLAQASRKSNSKPAQSAGSQNEPGSQAADGAGMGESLPAGDSGGTGTCVPGEQNWSVKSKTPPLPPEDGGNSSIDEASQEGETAANTAVPLTVASVNEADRPAIEHLLALRRHVRGIRGVLVPILAGCRLSSADKTANLTSLAADADGLSDEQMAKAVEIVLAAGRERIKPERIREALKSVRTFGAGVVIRKGTPEWDAWAAYAARTARANESGRVFDWWARYPQYTVPSAFPPKAQKADTKPDTEDAP